MQVNPSMELNFKGNDGSLIDEAPVIYSDISDSNVAARLPSMPQPFLSLGNGTSGA
jgi:hypothetical protein